jgi:mannosylglucosylglycerate synthase
MAETRTLRIGFVATRFAGTDGVSLEAEKWARELRGMGHDIYYFAGIVDRPPDKSREVPEAFFGHPDVAAISASAFGGGATAARPESTSRAIEELTAHLTSALRGFVRDFGLDMLLPENAVTIPMHLPLGLAITQLAAETGIPVLAHHHDLPWERQRFLINSVSDILSMAFPPPLPNVRHVCINSAQQEQIARRLGRTARIIPNVMDFENPPAEPDDVTAGLRAELGLADDEVFVLQPVRVIPRKGIEHAVELLARLGRPARLVISHASGDEGLDYQARIREFARLLGVDVIWAADRVSDQRGTGHDGRLTYSLADMYDACDLVTYPSLIEGFGNAYLEAVYHRRPVFVNRYPVYDLDIRPKGFRSVEMDGFMTAAAVEATLALLDDATRIVEWTEANYQVGLRHFSHRVVRDGLRAELEAMFPA